MRHQRFIIFILGWLFNPVFGQDILYTITAEKINCHVTEITETSVFYTINKTQSDSININFVYLIQYANGLVEKLNAIEEPVTNRTDPIKIYVSKTPYSISLNTLAFYNSDITFLGERHLKNSAYTLGLLASYNFNTRTSWPNIWLALLTNAKKQYDIGTYFLFKPDGINPKHRSSGFIGCMLKYTAFTFEAEKQTVVYTFGVPQIVSRGFEKRNSSLLALMLSVGYDVQLNKTCFFRGLVSVGGFRVKNNYAEEISKKILQNQNLAGSSSSRINYLPKLYFGLCIGWQF